MVVFEDLFFESRGKPIKYNNQIVQMVDELQIRAETTVQLVFQSTNSEWRQGIALATRGRFSINGQRLNDSLVLWEDTAPKEIQFVVQSESGILQIKNVWDVGDGVVNSWHRGAGMIVATDNQQRRVYRCNDGHIDDDFDDLTFTLQTVDA